MLCRLSLSSGGGLSGGGTGSERSRTTQPNPADNSKIATSLLGDFSCFLISSRLFGILAGSNSIQLSTTVDNLSFVFSVNSINDEVFFSSPMMSTLALGSFTAAILNEDPSKASLFKSREDSKTASPSSPGPPVVFVDFFSSPKPI